MRTLQDRHTKVPAAHVVHLYEACSPFVPAMEAIVWGTGMLPGPVPIIPGPLLSFPGEDLNDSYVALTPSRSSTVLLLARLQSIRTIHWNASGQTLEAFRRNTIFIAVIRWNGSGVASVGSGGACLALAWSAGAFQPIVGPKTAKRWIACWFSMKQARHPLEAFQRNTDLLRIKRRIASNEACTPFESRMRWTMPVCR